MGFDSPADGPTLKHQKAMATKKIMHPFDVKIGEKYWPVFIRVEFGGQSHRDNAGYLSISGTEGPMVSGNARGSSLQIDMGYAHRDPKDNDKRESVYTLKHPGDLRFAKGWTADMWLDLLDIWKTWHLKDIESVPAPVIDSIKQLPDTDRKPNWV